MNYTNSGYVSKTASFRFIKFKASLECRQGGGREERREKRQEGEPRSLPLVECSRLSFDLHSAI